MYGSVRRIEDWGAFGLLLEELRPAVVRLCRRRGLPVARAEEVAQDTLLVAYLRRERFVRGSLRSWVLKIASFLCNNERRRCTEVVGAALPDRCHPGESPLGAVARVQAADRLQRALGTLRAPEQRALRLRYWEGRSYRDLEVELGLTGTSGARGLLQTLRRRLRRELDGRIDLDEVE